MSIRQTTPLLITNARVNNTLGNVLITDGLISEISAATINAPAGSEVIDAKGNALLCGLKDHHLHLASLAVSRTSVQCGPPDVNDAEILAEQLQHHAFECPGEWIRGIGYHESVAGDIDAAWLDKYVSDTPIRIQHRGGRLWVFNTSAMNRLQLSDHDPLERIDGRLTGRLFEGDAWVRKRMHSLGEARLPELTTISRELASYGITGITDTTPHNGPDELQWFQSASERGELLQNILVMGDARLDSVNSDVDGVSVGHHKFHLLESDLPEITTVMEAVRQSHNAGRNVAFHCVTRTELVFALSALKEAGVQAGDRIEHASITPPELLQDISDLGLTIVSQPGFIHERGEQYLEDVADEDQPWLYRLKAFLDAGVPLAGSSDAPYSQPNPWLAMQAAVSRQTRNGRYIGSSEALSPELALNLYVSDLLAPGQRHGGLQAGNVADLCLLGATWQEARNSLAEVRVTLTLKNGVITWSV